MAANVTKRLWEMSDIVDVLEAWKLRRLSPAMLNRLKTWAKSLKRDVHAVYLAAHDPRVPWYAKALALAVAGYALSPIDFIPDFIPVIGYLDDLIIIPLGIWFVMSLIPPEVIAEYRTIASAAADRPASKAAAAAIVSIWLLCTGAIGWYIWTKL
jgi:uncharacterized membrane protein YkvA (DUF1232 family)